MTLEALNTLDRQTLTEALRHCCGSTAWVKKMLAVFPVSDKPQLLDMASKVWQGCSEADWLEAFSHHPKIGASTANATAAAEQSGTSTATLQTRQALAEGNRAYEEMFGYIYIVCATGKSATEMLQLLQERLNNSPGKEILVAMGEQQKITHLRLEKLLA